MSQLVPQPQLDGSNVRSLRIELACAVFITLVGFALRVAAPTRLAVEHFDEGVYSSNVFFSDRHNSGGHYPDQHLYAPPLVPLLIEMSMLVLGTASAVPMLVGIIAGSLTVPMIWWVGRRWFGATAGLATATLAALSDVHIFYSRSALTDVLLCLWLLLAVYFAGKALAGRRWAATILAGLFTGLAWWTKYNGWLPLAIGLAGIVAWRLFARQNNAGSSVPEAGRLALSARSLGRPLVVWLAIAVIAVLIWSPWLWMLEQEGRGGYAAVAANHRGYIVGAAGWWQSFTLQARKLGGLEGIPTAVSLGAVLVVALFRLRLADRRFTWNVLARSDLAVFALPVAGLAFVAEGAGLILASLGAVGVVLGVRRSIGSQPTGDLSPQRVLAGWLLAAWFLGLLLTIPFYTPYLRLTLPLLLASWLGFGILVDAVVGELAALADGQSNAAGSERGPARTLVPIRVRVVVVAILVLAIVLAARERDPLERGVPGWAPRTSLAEQAPRILEDAARNASVELPAGLDRFAIYTYADPALLFNLRQLGCRYVNPVKDVAFARPGAPAPQLPSFVVIGPQAWRTPGFGEQMAPALPRLELVGKYWFAPSDLVLLDGPLIRSTGREEYQLELYRIR